MRVSDVKSVPLDIVETFVRIYTGRRHAALQLDRLEWRPRSELFREIGASRICGTTEYATRTAK